MKRITKIVDHSKQIANDAFVKLSNEILLNALPESDVRRLLANYISYAEEKDFHKFFPRIVMRKRVRDVLLPKITELTKLGTKSGFRPRSYSRILFIFECQFRSEALLLKQFLEGRSKFESALLAGNYDLSLEVLSSIREEAGESLWLIRSTLVTLSLAGRLEEMSQYCDRCKEQIDDAFLSFVLNCFLLVSTDPLLHSSKVVASTIAELSQADVQAWSDLLVLFFVPSTEVSVQKRLSCAHLLQNYSLIDQYILLAQLLSNNLAVCLNSGDKPSTQEQRLMKLIVEHNHQHQLKEEEVRKAITSYEVGNYSEVDDIFQTALLESRSPAALINLNAKGQAILRRRPDPALTGPLGDIALALRDLIRIATPPAQSINSLRSTSVQLNCIVSSWALDMSLHSALPHYYNPATRAFVARRAKLQSTYSPVWIDALAADEDPILYGGYDAESAALPDHRDIKQKIRNLALAGSADTEEIVGLLSRYKTEAPLVRDYLELASSVYMYIGRMDLLVETCANELPQLPYAFTAFPLSKLVEHIEDNKLCNLESLLVLHYYVKNVDGSKEYVLNEAFEEFMLASEVDRPSLLVASKDAVSPAEKILLRDIATVETMDFLGTFEGSNDVRAERIKIVDLLREIGEIDAATHRTEVDEIVGSIVVDSGATEFSVHKINVNDNAIRRKLSEDIASLLSLYRSAADTKEAILKVDADNSADDGWDIARAVVAGDKNTTLLKILSVVTHEFLYDEKHGLDQNLSAEIRHGFFPNLMRSKLEERKLLTETDEQGLYKSNEYWKDANQLLNDNVIAEIDEHLKWFSSMFNSAIAEAEEWMKVTTDVKEVNRVFNFSLYVDQFSPLKPKVDAARSPEEVINVCLELLWQMTERSLSEVRERINVDLKQRVDELFDQLINRLDETRGPAAIADLLNSVRQTKNDIREDISTIAEWFKKGGVQSDRMLSIGDLIDISVECYSRVRRIPLNMSRTTDSAVDELKLDGRHMKSFVVSLLNLFENCLRHSGFGAETEVQVSSSASANGWNVSVSNPVSPPVLEALRTGGLDKIRANMREALAPELVSKEGGTGLPKVVNHMGAISDKINIQVGVDGSTLIVRMAYVS